ncbi:unnamed protein product [Ectocarpus sp. CCAP 1310/34]|nr:unnamed protein product [Ectocarpus sp. CCAP 1310/34]
MFRIRTLSATREKARNRLGWTATRACTKRSGSRLVMLGLATAAPEQWHRSSGTGAVGRHRTVAHGQTSLVLSIIFPFFS